MFFCSFFMFFTSKRILLTCVYVLHGFISIFNSFIFFLFFLGRFVVSSFIPIGDDDDKTSRRNRSGIFHARSPEKDNSTPNEKTMVNLANISAPNRKSFVAESRTKSSIKLTEVYYENVQRNEYCTITNVVSKYFLNR